MDKRPGAAKREALNAPKRRPGRPKGSMDKVTVEQRATLSELARSYTAQALAALVSIMEDEMATDASRVTAACAILDRGYGRPAQSVEVAGPGGGPIQTEDVPPAETARRIAFLLSAADRDATKH